MDSDPGAHVSQRSLRGRFNAFVQRNEVPWELTFAAFAVVYVAVGFAGDDATGETARRIAIAEIALTALFFGEFVARFVASYDRRRYLRGHWIDLVALIPAIRGFRVLRLLRLLRLVRALSGVYRAVASVERLTRHRGFAALVLSWLGVMVISSIAVYVAEHGQNDSVQTPFDALWWGVVTLTTVGYGDVSPVTPEGRVAAMVLMLLGITLFAAITATLTSFLLSDRRTPAPPTDPREGYILSIIQLRDAGLLEEDEAVAAFTRLVEPDSGA